jgi:uncharacterized protein with FMN-binding domain
MTLGDAIDRRMSVRQFGEKAVEMDKVSWLLWAIGKCSPQGIQAGDIYVKIDSTAYILSPDKTTLMKTDSLPPMRIGGSRPGGRPGEAPPGAPPGARPGEAPPMARPGENPPPGGQGNAQARPGGPPRMDAPLMLVLNAASKEGGNANDTNLWLWRGFAGEAMYLGAPALGLGIVTIGGVGFRAGYPAEEAQFTPNPGPEGKPFPFLGKATVMTLEEAIAKDNSTIAPKAQVGQETVDALFWSAYGFSHVKENNRAHRTVPSARNRYPMGVCGLSGQGLVRYKPDQNGTESVKTGDLRSDLAKAVGDEWINGSPYVYILDWDRSILSSRNMALYEAGSMLANMIWMANAWDVGLRWTLISDTTAVRNVLGSDPASTRVPLMAVGIFGPSTGAAPNSSKGIPAKTDISFPKGVSVRADAAAGYKDGQYEGQCSVWPEMKVLVTVKNRCIDQVAVLSDNGTPDFSKPVVETLPKAMAAQNKIDVDGISGSTLSSNNLKKAVRDALSKAR